MVLRDFLSDDQILDLNKRERNRQFIEKIYANPKEYIFFPIREKVLTCLDSIINAKTGEKIEYNDDLIDWKESRYSSIPEYKAE